jgi:hypothetical protein
VEKVTPPSPLLPPLLLPLLLLPPPELPLPLVPLSPASPLATPSTDPSGPPLVVEEFPLQPIPMSMARIANSDMLATILRMPVKDVRTETTGQGAETRPVLRPAREWTPPSWAIVSGCATVGLHEGAGMFGKIASLFGSKPAPPPAPGSQLAMPLFASVSPVDPAAVLAAWARLFPGQPSLRVEAHEGPRSPVQYGTGGGVSLMAIHIPAPVPKDEALHAVKTSWMWQQPDTAVRQHVAHAIVAAVGADDVIGAAWNVARLSAAMLAAAEGAALYWGNGGQVHTPEVVEKFAQSEKTPPVPLWVGITISGESRSGPFSAATHGLAPLGHKEFEVRGTTMRIGDLRGTLLDLAAYVLRQGHVLEHGQTFGPTAEQRWGIRHEASKLLPGREVILLGIP